MTLQIGLWIDYRKALIAGITDHGDWYEEIPSYIERQLRRTGDVVRCKIDSEQLHIPVDDRQKRVVIGHLNAYYDTVITRLHKAETILLFGPAEAKDELRKRMENNKLGERIIAVETVDKMTNLQIAEKVRLRYQK